MLTALPTLPAQLKADPAPASQPRPGAPFAGDNSFASLIRRQAEQRLDSLRLADQQALAARVSAAAARSMPRPVIAPLASPAPTPGQTPARPSPPPPLQASHTADAAATAAPAQAPAGAGASQPSPAQTRPPQAAAPRPKPPGIASRPEDPRGPAGRSGQADGATTHRSQRERKAGTAPDAEASAVAAAAATAGLPLLLADTGPTGLVGDGGNAAGTELAAGLQPASALPQDLTGLPAAQAPAAIGPPAGPDAQAEGGTGPIGSRSAPTRHSSASRALAKAEAMTTAAGLPPDQALADDRVPARTDAASPVASHAGSASLPALGAAPQGLDGDAAETLLAPRRHGPGGPDALAAAQPDRVGAAPPPGAWRPGSTPAAGDNPSAPADTPLARPRAGPGIDHNGPEPRHPAGPAAVNSLAAAAPPTAQARPDVAAPGAFDTALQAALSQGPAQAGAVAGTVHSAARPLALQIDAAVDSPLFAPSLGSQLSLLARDGVRSALLQLHPADMGPISVTIALDGNAARIDFQALRADTRSLIEASLPALAGALQDAGLTLAGGGVFEQAPGRQPQAQAEPAPGARPAGLADGGPAAAQDTAQPAGRTAPRGLVDLVA